MILKERQKAHFGFAFFFFFFAATDITKKIPANDTSNLWLHFLDIYDKFSLKLNIDLIDYFSFENINLNVQTHNLKQYNGL